MSKPPQPCLTRDDLERLHAGELPSERAAAVEAHLRTCPACQRLDAALVAEHEAMLAELRGLGIDRPDSSGAAGGAHAEQQAAPAGARRAAQPPAEEAAAARSTATAGPAAPAAPQRIGPYRILSELGAGGMGVVYLAEQREPVRRTVALKLIKLGMDTRDVIARFESERQALALMNHPNVARVLDAGATPDGRPYFVMEHVQGVPITKHCDAHKLSIRERLDLFMQVCHAVQHAHQKGVIHRDIKPSNVLVQYTDGAAVPKVIDFGVAKAVNQRLTEHTLFTQQGVIVGTPEYMSPEQADFTAQDIDTRTDIYSLGVLLYELLTGALPFDSRSLRSAGYAEMQRIIREVEPPKPSTRLAALGSMGVPPVRDGGDGDGDRCEKGFSHQRQPAMGVPPVECGTGVPPVAGDAAAAPARRRPRDEPSASAAEIAQLRRSDPRTLLRTVRGELDWIVMKCLEKDRARRYDTANGLALEVQRYLNNEPVLAGPPSAAYRLRKFIRRNRAGVIAASLVAAALLIGLGGTTWGVFWALGERSRADAERDAALKARDETTQVAGFLSRMITTLDPTTAGVRLTEDVNHRLVGALEKAGIGEAERVERTDAFQREWAQLNARDVSATFIDTTILRPAVVAIQEQFKNQPAVQAQLLEAVAAQYSSLGLHSAALPLRTSALRTRRRELGEEHADTITSINNMGRLLHELNKLPEAGAYYSEALEKCLRVFGEENPSTLTTLANIGSLLQAQRRFAEAEPYLAKVLATRRRVLGETDVDTIRAINNMGGLFHDERHFSQAQPYYEEALQKCQSGLGEEHPLTLSVKNNLGSVLLDQGNILGAEPYYKEVLEKRRRILGEEHPATLTSMNNLGDLLRAKGDPAGAELQFRNVLAIQRRTLGDADPHTLTTLHNLARALYTHNRLPAAESYCREAVVGRRRLYGDSDAATRSSISLLGGILKAQGRLDEAEQLFKEALDHSRRRLGDGHADTLTDVTNLGLLLDVQGKHPDAVDLLAPAEAACRKAFAGGNPVRLGGLLMALGGARASLPYEAERFAAAEANLTEALALIRSAPGKQDGSLRRCMQSLIDLYMAWHTAQPDQGYDAKAAEWRAKLAEWQASTQPAARENSE